MENYYYLNFAENSYVIYSKDEFTLGFADGTTYEDWQEIFETNVGMTESGMQFNISFNNGSSYLIGRYYAFTDLLFKNEYDPYFKFSYEHDLGCSKAVYKNYDEFAVLYAPNTMFKKDEVISFLKENNFNPKAKKEKKQEENTTVEKVESIDNTLIFNELKDVNKSLYTINLGISFLILYLLFKSIFRGVR